MDKLYIGEQLWIGVAGNFSIALAFSAALLAAFAYWMSGKTELADAGWRKMGRTAFYVHALGVFSIVGLIFYMLLAHRFEYYYAWQHTSKDLPNQYVFASFWEGQEGSFLLWTFWHVVLGLILIKQSKDWEPGVLSIMALVQVFLMSMVVGIVIDIPELIDYKIGSNPFTLTREHPSMLGLPFVQNENYLSSLDGRGLNPALQNYWMVIHPPTLFLGFALTVVPFAFALAGLQRKQYTQWMRPALPWAFAGIMILGGGILMGGAWAYEALNFGGFWAWDPVENSSLVPWLTLAAGAHLLLLPKRQGVTLISAFLLIISSFVLVLYSTFLTRSGVLGDASVHSFTDLGLTGQLLLYLFFFGLLPVWLVAPKAVIRWNLIIGGIIVFGWGAIFEFDAISKVLIFIYLAGSLGYFIYRATQLFPASKEEDNLYSRELWMFIGALLLVVSAVHLTFETSKPVINKLIGTSYAPGSVENYNLVQGAIAVVLIFIIAFGQFLSYKRTDKKAFFKNVSRALFLSIGIILVAMGLVERFRNPLNVLLAFTSLYAVLANADYIIQFLKNKWKLAGASIAHIGFALILLGSVVSAGHKIIISQNQQAINLEDLNPDFKNNENVMLHKNDTTPMGPYHLAYRGAEAKGNEVFYKVDYYQVEQGAYKPAFTLYPKLITNPRMGNVPEPSTAHFWDKDIFTHVTYVDLDRVKAMQNPESSVGDGYKEPQHFKVKEGEKIFGTSFYVIFEGIQSNTPLDTNSLDLDLRGVFTVHTLSGLVDTVYPAYVIKDNGVRTKADIDEITGLKIEVEEILPDERKIAFTMSELKQSEFNDFIIMQAIIFPGINLLWTGCILLVLGTLLAVIRRFNQS